MTVVILTACPPGLRGHLTRWLLEISPGVFVGVVPARVRDLIWDRIVEMVARGRAIMVHSTRGEQRLAFRTHGHDWAPVDYDGIQLMRRPRASSHPEGSGSRASAPKSWSHAGRRRRFG